MILKQVLLRARTTALPALRARTAALPALRARTAALPCCGRGRLRSQLHFIILCFLLGVLAGCSSNKPVRHLPHLGETPYQQDSVLVTYAANPERALALLDSALILGNISDYRGQFIRAKIYSRSLMEQRRDSAIIICEALLDHDSVCNEPMEQENILDVLISASRSKHDIDQYLHWATQKAELCQQQGNDAERWRTEADIGLVMTNLGLVNEGLAKLDEAISNLDVPGSIDRMDAFIVVAKRKINALNELNRFDEVLALAQRILDRLDHYEQHAKEYAEDSYRLSWSDNPTDRDRYLDFSRAQAWGFMAQAYAMKSSPQARYYLSLFDSSDYGKTAYGRRMIAPTQIALGMYSEALATYDEIERRMGSDTLNADYAIILRSRAVAAYGKRHFAEAFQYQTRYADLLKVVSDSLHKSEAHEYAARYHAQEQQLKIQEREAEAERSNIVSIAIAVIALLAIAFALYFFHQKNIVSQKNHALVRMINEQQKTDTAEQHVKSAEQMADATEQASQPIDNSQSPLNSQLSIANSQLFNDIDTAIRSERLYSDVALQRQDICNRFGISRHTLNELLANYADGLSFPQYINAIRIQHALRLLREEPSKTVTTIAAEVGFTPSNLREQFKREFGMTPAEFRQNL